MMTSSSRMGVVLKEEHMLADVSTMMSSELRRHCNHLYLIISKLLSKVFPHLPEHPSNEFTCTDTLHYDPFLFFDGTCHKTQSQTNRHPPLNVIAVVDNHPLPPFASLALVPSPPPSYNQWYHYPSFLEERVLSSEREHDANAYINLLFTLGRQVIQTGAQTEEGGWRRRLLGYYMSGAFFLCSKVFTIAKNFEKNKGK